MLYKLHIKYFVFFAKYSQFIIAINLKKMILTIILFYFKLFIFFTQLVHLLVSKLSQEAYWNSNWYNKIVSFFLDSFIIFDNLNYTEKRAVKWDIIKYQMTNQHFFYIKQDRKICNNIFKITKCCGGYSIHFNG